MTQSTKIAPSILAADFAHLAEAVASADAAGADYIHVDVMDGHFVPNITVGPPVVRALRRITHLPLDVHLMISDPARYVPVFAAAGADGLTVHVEATPHLHRILQQIRDSGARPGVSLNPATPAIAINEVLNDVELVLVMTVNPGFGGQAFIKHTLHKIAQVREMLDRAGSDAELEVDGGIGPQVAEQVVAAGATVLVAGEAIFGAPEGVVAALAAIREKASKGQRIRSKSRQKRSPQL
ncbi:MAG: ribulose-phosphate 3-epimerase [Chloroflexota bacterium]|nr:ribulose-phosphate 3-epimerase [Chloroflexota bacterium]